MFLSRNKKKEIIHSKLDREIQRKRSGKTKPWQAAVGVLVIVGLAAYFGYINIPGITPKTQAIVNNSTSTTTSSAAGGTTSCSTSQIQSMLTTYNSQAITSGTVTVYQTNAAGTLSKVPSASVAQTLNTLTTTGSAPVSTPWYSTWNSSVAYPDTVQVSGSIGANSVPLTNLGTNQAGGSILCSTNIGNNNQLTSFQQQGFVYLAPAAGTSAVTNLKAVLNSQISQTNSFPAAFPITSAQTETDYLQLFGNSLVAMQGTAVVGSTNAPITNYGGVAGQPVTGGVAVNNGLVYYQGYAIVAFNQTYVSFTGPSGTVPLTVQGQNGERAWLIPVNSATCGPTPTSGTATTNPFTGCSITFSVQQTVATQTKHIAMAVIWADETQAGYIQQYFTGPAATTFCTAGSAFGFPTGFSGIVPSTSTNAPHPLIEQYSCTVATS